MAMPPPASNSKRDAMRPADGSDPLFEALTSARKMTAPKPSLKSDSPAS